MFTGRERPKLRSNSNQRSDSRMGIKSLVIKPILRKDVVAHNSQEGIVTESPHESDSDVQ